jgi:CBS domain-containing protein
MQIEDLMRTPPQSVTTVASIGEARALLRWLNTNQLPVVDQSGVLVGVVGGTGGHGDVAQPVAAIMKRGPAFVDYDDDLEEAASLMSEHDLDELPVIGARGDLIGLVHRHDVLSGLSST